MALKITSRFAPSVVRAAHMAEAIIAAFSIGDDCKVDRGTIDKVREASVGDYCRIADKNGDREVFGREVAQCVSELKAERKRQAQERRERRLAREREKAMLIEQGAFA